MDYLEAVEEIRRSHKELEAIAILSRSALTHQNELEFNNFDFINRLKAIRDYNDFDLNNETIKRFTG